MNNIVTLVPEGGVLPRLPQGPRSIGDITREQLIQIAMRMERPLEALMAMDVRDLRKSRREARRHLQFMTGVLSNARGWQSLLDRAPTEDPRIKAYGFLSERQVQAARSLCRDYRKRLRMLRLAIQFIEASNSTPAV